LLNVSLKSLSNGPIRDPFSLPVRLLADPAGGADVGVRPEGKALLGGGGGFAAGPVHAELGDVRLS
jgi:hypothetical protein